MNKGEVDYAVRQALNNFDKWNDVTGFVMRGTGYYYELQSLIEDAVRIGGKIACQGIDAGLNNIIDK
jgi:hypothetical protein